MISNPGVTLSGFHTAFAVVRGWTVSPVCGMAVRPLQHTVVGGVNAVAQGAPQLQAGQVAL